MKCEICEEVATKRMEEKISKQEIAKVIAESSLYNLGKDSHNALSELVEAIYGLLK